MIGLQVEVPIACWKKAYINQFIETEKYPPLSTSYGFVLSYIGEENMNKYKGVKMTIGMIKYGIVMSEPKCIQKRWRYKSTKVDYGSGVNKTLDFIQHIVNNEFIVWIDDNGIKNSLEQKVKESFYNPQSVTRFGSLSFGASHYLVNTVNLIDNINEAPESDIFCLNKDGNIRIMTWANYTFMYKTRYACGAFQRMKIPNSNLMPIITDV